MGIRGCRHGRVNTWHLPGNIFSQWTLWWDTYYKENGEARLIYIYLLVCFYSNLRSPLMRSFLKYLMMIILTPLRRMLPPSRTLPKVTCLPVPTEQRPRETEQRTLRHLCYRQLRNAVSVIVICAIIDNYATLCRWSGSQCKNKKSFERQRDLGNLRVTPREYNKTLATRNPADDLIRYSVVAGLINQDASFRLYYQPPTSYFISTGAGGGGPHVRRAPCHCFCPLPYFGVGGKIGEWDRTSRINR